MTILTGENSGGSGAYFTLANVETSANGHVFGNGNKLGGLTLGTFGMPECCFHMSWSYDFSEAGFPTNIDHDFLTNAFHDNYFLGYRPFRFNDAHLVSYYYTGAPPPNHYTRVTTPSWQRTFYYTTLDVRSSMGGHMRIDATPMSQYSQFFTPTDYGDGVPMSDARTVKYAPNGDLEFNVPLGSLTLGAYIDPLGKFFDLSRTTTTITLAKQDEMGVPSWTKTYSAPMAAGTIPALAHTFDTSGNMYVAFNFNGTADLGNGPMASIGIHDLGLAKIDVNGNTVWSKHFGTPTFDLQTVGLRPTGSADMLLVATFAGTADLGNGPFTGGSVLAKFDATGAVLWRAPAPAGSYSIRGNEAGEAFVVSAEETVDFGWGPLLAGKNIDGVVVAKYDLCSSPGACRPMGATCNVNADCESGYCVDGVCCDSFCNGPCQACSAALNSAGVDGACGPAFAGMDPEGDCNGGSCTPAGVCSMAGNGASCTNGTECSSTFCVDGVCCDNACSGQCQACTMMKKGSGIDGVCEPVKTDTNPDNECIKGACTAAGVCIYELGGACTVDANCTSGHCVEGLCCDTVCDGICMACAGVKTGASDGSCKPIAIGTDPDVECAGQACNGAGACSYPNGTPCDSGPLDCSSGHCVEGICCENACTGRCMACTAAKTGLAADGLCGSIPAGTDPDDECVGSVCDVSNTCASISCNIGSDCPTGQCSNGTCSGIWQLAANGAESCALFLDGRVKCWGENSLGQLGLGDTNNRGDMPGEMGANLPFVDLGTGRFAKKIAIGFGEVCALLNGGAIVCLGLNGSGLGDNLVPVNLGTGVTAIDVARGYRHACAVLNDGRVKCWGTNNHGQLGLGNTTPHDGAPNSMGDFLPAVELGSGRTAKAITVGYDVSCAILDNGSVKCWGFNDSGQLGLGHTESRGNGPNEMGDFLPAVDLGTGKTALEISMNHDHVCARLNDGTVKCWGKNTMGQLGLGNTIGRGVVPGQMGDKLPIVDLGTGKTATQIHTGEYHSCALLDDATIKCWGGNSSGLLGQGHNTYLGDNPGEMGNNLPPVNLGLGKTVLRFWTGKHHTCVLLNDGGVKCWGWNNDGQLGLGDTMSRGNLPTDMGDNLPFVQLQ